MIIYQESQAKDCPIAQKIVSQYTDATVLDIKHYKNVFDKQLVIPENEKAILLAKNTGSFALPAPVGYGHAGKGYFLRNTYNCPFSCQYCYLQGAFKHRALTVFVNYDDLKQEIQNICNQYPDEEIWFYASNWSDPLGTEMVTHFCQEFIPFIDSIPNARLEIRSKSNYIDPLVDTIAVSPNTEVCFSLNPQEIIAKYEWGTANLDQRIDSINTLLEKWWKVGLRLLPLLEVEGYQDIYTQFKEEVESKIDIQRISSVFVGGLMYVEKDYKQILKKQPGLDLLTYLKKEEGMYRESREARDFFYTLFEDWKDCQICLDAK